ncbi:hypothetical protein NHF46_11875 [Arthrobacter alpinus]|nr:hypothetical protein [Arthrobacter alpinus]
MEQQLVAMKQQEETTYKATLAQLQSATDLASAERKDRAAMVAREALAKHLTAWSAVRSAILRADEDLHDFVQSADATGIVWRMLHADQKSQLFKGDGMVKPDHRGRTH